MMKRNLSRTLLHFILFIYVIIVVFPLLFVFTSSMKDNTQIFDDPWGLPTSLNFSNYIDTLTNDHIGNYFFNSLYISTISTLITLLLSTAIAYAVTRMKFPTASKGVYGLLLISILVPPASLLIPLYIMISNFGLINTPLALILPYSTFGIPLTVFVVAAFLKSIPLELEEAGIMDGLTTYGLLFRIVIPLTLPTLVTVFILNFIGNWNEYIMAMIFVSNPSLRTMPLAVASFADKFNMNYGGLTAAISISIIPVILIYAFLQKYIIEGVTAGSVKG